MIKYPKHVLITGASGGLGSALALAYAKNNSGIHLSLFGRNIAALDNVATACRAFDVEVSIYALDLRDIETLTSTVTAIDIAHSIDLVIANAGIAVYLDANHPLETMAEAQNSISTNLISAIATVNPLITRMQHRQRGQIAFISSIAAYHGLAISPSYCASKAGLKAYSEALRSLLKTNNIGVSVICPGFIESNMSQSFHGNKPFLLSAEKSAYKILSGLKHNRACITFPYWLSLGTRLLNFLPHAVSDFCIRMII